jgi:hypothetical protein
MMLNNQPFIENKDTGAFAQAIVDPVREPLLVLDKDPRVRGVLSNFQQLAPVSTTIVFADVSVIAPSALVEECTYVGKWSA